MKKLILLLLLSLSTIIIVGCEPDNTEMESVKYLGHENTGRNINLFFEIDDNKFILRGSFRNTQLLSVDSTYDITYSKDHRLLNFKVHTKKDDEK